MNRNDKDTHKEVCQVLVTPEGMKWIRDHEAQIKDRLIPLTSNEAVITRIVSIMSDAADNGEDPATWSISERFLSKCMKELKEAIPELPDNALQAAVAYCVEKMVEVITTAPEAAKAAFAHFGIEIDSDSMTLDRIPVDEN